MTYRVEITETAKSDIRLTAQWLSDHRSPDFADQWLVGLFDAMGSLEKQPYLFPLAPETTKFQSDIRELLYGETKQSRHRVIFEVIESKVYVLYVRHAARDEIGP